MPNVKRRLPKWENQDLTKEERKHPLAKCEECPIGKRGKFVETKFPVISGKRIAFVGEAPAFNEVRGGEPFIGASGQLLNQVLEHYGITRDESLFANACSCQYPKEWDKLPADAIEACRPRLLSELDIAGVDTVVAMGNSALVSVQPTMRGVVKHRAGPPKRVRLQESDESEIDLIPTFHPAACLRNQANFPLMTDDIGKAIATDKPSMWYEPSIIVVDEPLDVPYILEELEKRNRDYGLVVDTESGRDKDTEYGRDDGVFGNVLCVGVGGMDNVYGDTVHVFTDRAIGAPGSVNRLLLQKVLNSTGLIAQNGKYDIGVLMNYLDQEEPFPLVADTMLQSYCINENGGIHGLKYMGKEILHCPDWDSEIKPFITKEHGYGSIPRDMLYKYNAFDVHATRLLYSYFSAFIEEQGLTRLSAFLHKISWMLTKVEARGLAFDMEVSGKLAQRLQYEKAEIEAQLPTFVMPKVKTKYRMQLQEDGTKQRVKVLEHYEEEQQLNPRSSVQIIEYFKQHGFDLASSDSDHLEFLVDMLGVDMQSQEDDTKRRRIKITVEQILSSRKVSKLDGTYVTGLQKKVTGAGRVHTSFLIHGTNTGRLSSRGPNLQNIPRAGDVKAQFIAQPGTTEYMWQVDYSQAELRVLAWLGNEPLFIDCFNDPTRDIFDEVCDNLFPGYIDKKYIQDVTGVLNTDKEQYEREDTKAECKEVRTLIKTFAYGIAYRRTAAGIAADPAFHMDVKTATKHLDAFMSQIPNIMKFQQEGVIDRIKGGHDLVNPFGRRKRFWLLSDLNKDNVYREASAFLPQATASDMCLDAAIQATEQGVDIRNLIHDAQLGCSPTYEQALRDVALVDRLMCEAADRVTGGVVKFATDAKIGKSWYEVK